MSWVEELFGMADTGLGAINWGGHAVRSLVSGEDPLAAPLQASRQMSGRDLLEKWGWIGENQPGVDWGDAAGIAADIATDPITYVPLVNVGYWGIKGLKGLASLLKGGGTAALSDAVRRAGPSIASQLSGKGLLRNVGADLLVGEGVGLGLEGWLNPSQERMPHEPRRFLPPYPELEGEDDEYMDDLDDGSQSLLDLVLAELMRV